MIIWTPCILMETKSIFVFTICATGSSPNKQYWPCDLNWVDACRFFHLSIIIIYIRICAAECWPLMRDAYTHCGLDAQTFCSSFSPDVTVHAR